MLQTNIVEIDQKRELRFIFRVLGSESESKWHFIPSQTASICGQKIL